jgi:radical SAM superfamily enzyme YgiQ (UPF0313 family)
MFKILLVKSTTSYSKHTGTPPPLGIMYLASYLQAGGYDSIRLFDARLYKEPVKELYKLISEYRPDIVGVSALTLEASYLHTVAYITKSIDINIKVVAGGPYATSTPSTLMNDKNIDVGVIGEGEITFKELLDSYEHDGDLYNIRGIVFKSHNGFITTPSRPYIEALDTLPYPSWDLIDLNAYFVRRGMSTIGIRRYMTILTSRGCPFHCTYCHNIMGKKFRARSVDNVLKEMQVLIEAYHINDFEIIDDISNFDRERFKRILKGIIDKGWKITLSFPNGVRTDMLDEEIIHLMKKAGTSELSVAIETASQRLQKMVKKNLHLEKIKKMIDIAVKDGIFVRGFFMLGFPTETEEELRSTINFACMSRLHEAIFFKVNPFGGTELYKQANERGKLPSSDMNTSNFSYYTTSFNLSELSNRKFNRLYTWAYIRFYFSMKRIFSILKTKKMRNDLFLLGIRVLEISFVGIFRRNKQLEPIDIDITNYTKGEQTKKVIYLPR